MARAIQIPLGRDSIAADLRLPADPRGLVIFAHGSGSSRFSRRNTQIAEVLDDRGFATLLLDLLTTHEESIDVHTMEYRFDIPRLGSRVIAAIGWARERPDLWHLPLGLFGASTGAAAALIGAADRRREVGAVVCRGGRPDLANDALAHVTAPTLLIVGGDDTEVIELNRAAMARMTAARVDLAIVPGATHLFEEPGTLEEVERLACAWFAQTLTRSHGHARGSGVD